MKQAEDEVGGVINLILSEVFQFKQEKQTNNNQPTTKKPQQNKPNTNSLN